VRTHPEVIFQLDRQAFERHHGAGVLKHSGQERLERGEIPAGSDEPGR